MQPLNATVRPSAESTIGWPPAGLRSMIESRRWPSAIAPRAQIPEPSGPRRFIASVTQPQAATSAARPSNRISPLNPHI